MHTFLHNLDQPIVETKNIVGFNLKVTGIYLDAAHPCYNIEKYIEILILENVFDH